MTSASNVRYACSSSIGCRRRSLGASWRKFFTAALLCGMLVSAGLSLAESPVSGQNEIPSVGLLSARALALNPTNGKLYAVDSVAGTVSIVSGATHETSTVKVGARPVAIAVDAVTNRVYVANNGSASVSVLDGSTDAVV